MLVDNTDLTKKPPQIPKSLSLVLNNALFKTTAVNGCLLFGTLAEDFIKVERGALFLSLGMHAYLPTLPDPYAANINLLKFQFRGTSDRALLRQQSAGRVAVVDRARHVGTGRGEKGQGRRLVPFRTAA